MVFSVAAYGHSWKQIFVESWQAVLGEIDAIGDVDDAVEKHVSIKSGAVLIQSSPGTGLQHYRRQFAIPRTGVMNVGLTLP